jgi:hypothetical protein
VYMQICKQQRVLKKAYAAPYLGRSGCGRQL